MRTHFLNLTKPVPGATNWGPSLNQNWDTVDRSYGQLQQNITTLEQKMTDIGTFSYIQTFDSNNDLVEYGHALFSQGYVAVTPEGENTTWYRCRDIAYEEDTGWVANCIKVQEPANKITDGAIYIGSVPNDSTSATVSHFERATISPYDAEYYNNQGTEAQLSTLNDYTAFQVCMPKLNNGEVPASKENTTKIVWWVFGTEWAGNEIMIKTSTVKNNKRETLITKFKQGLGGYYVPRIDSDNPNLIVWSKTPGSEAISKYNTIIPHNLWEGSKADIEINTEFNHYETGLSQTVIHDNVTYTCALADICFWRSEPNDKRTKIYINYWILVKNDKFIIYWDNVLPSTDKFYVSFIYTRYIIPNNASAT